MKDQDSSLHIQFSKSKGFTFVELLAVIFVFITVGTLIMSILVAVLRGNDKTNVITNATSNGNFAILQMQKSIRNATAIKPTFSCGTVASPTATSAVALTFPSGNTITYSCVDSNGNATLSSNSASMVDSNAITVASCRFTCGQDVVGGYPIIGIDFSLQTKTTSVLADQKASASAIEFQTSVVMRNSIR